MSSGLRRHDVDRSEIGVIRISLSLAQEGPTRLYESGPSLRGRCGSRMTSRPAGDNAPSFCVDRECLTYMHHAVNLFPTYRRDQITRIAYLCFRISAA